MTSHRGDAVSSPAQHVLRAPAGVGAQASGCGPATALAAGPSTAVPHHASPPMPETAGAASASAALRVECSREGFARARSFTRRTLDAWRLGHHGDDAALVVTELTANAATHAAPRCTGGPEVRLGLRLGPAHLLLTVSDSDDRPPVHRPGSGSLLEHGRGLCIVDALSEAWGWSPTPPAGKTVWARLSTHPPI
ncbi:ATP-binding protein [Streptomyces sp. NPDC101219]|uniref:ATP-binding protein n=1 Tax=Streptomyces sp. NPDC101219 TaxID=3366131 RepID=UPI0038087BB8